MEEQKVENEPPDEGEIEGTKVKSKRKNLSHDDKKGIFTMLVMHSTYGKLNSSKVCGDIALRYGCSVDVVQRIWREGKRIDAANPVDLNGFLERLKSKRGRTKSTTPVPFEEDLFKAIPRNKRRSFRSMEYQLIEMTGGSSKRSLKIIVA